MKEEQLKELGFLEEEINFIRRKLNREPTTEEWGVLSLNWSEHCSYKTSRKFLNMLPRSGKHLVLGPGQNAGVIRIENTNTCIAFKVESHNHPSAVDPINGAATGVGGIVRDVLSMGAVPVALLDSLRFGEKNWEKTKRLLDGVVRGIGFYGNSIGVPTVGGELEFGVDYEDNPLVNVLCLGLVSIDEIKLGILGQPGNLLVVIGAPTGPDGIHGASFASLDLKYEDEWEKIPNIQIGDPFFGKLLIDVVLEISKIDGVVGIQDLGAGGLSTAPVEMAERSKIGVELNLDLVPLRGFNLSPYQILLSESQERIIISVDKNKKDLVLPKIEKITKKWGLDFGLIGVGIPERRFIVKFGGKIYVDLPNSIVFPLEIDQSVYLTPKIERSLENHSSNPLRKNPPSSLADLIVDYLDCPDLVSKEFVYSQYDWSVQTQTILGPGDHDSALVWLKNTKIGIGLTIDCNWRWLLTDPYEGTRRVVAEAYSNLIATGCKPVGITDCLNFSNPQEKITLDEFEKCIKGLKEAAENLDLPVASGNVSFYNQSFNFRIPPTPTIGMVGINPDITFVPKGGFLQEGNPVYLVGKNSRDLGGSIFLWIYDGCLGKFVEEIDLEYVKYQGSIILEVIKDRLILSCHDVSKGGILYGLITMINRGKKGFSLDKNLPLNIPEFLFSEMPGRWIVEVPANRVAEFEKRLKDKGLDLLYLGRVSPWEDGFKLGDHTISLEIILTKIRRSLL